MLDSNGLVHTVDKPGRFSLFSMRGLGLGDVASRGGQMQTEIEKLAELRGLAATPRRQTSQEKPSKRRPSPKFQKHMNPKLYLRLLLILNLANTAGKK